MPRTRRRWPLLRWSGTFWRSPLPDGSLRFVSRSLHLHLARSAPIAVSESGRGIGWELRFPFAEARSPDLAAPAQRRLPSRLVRRLQTKRRELRSESAERWHAACSVGRRPLGREGGRHDEVRRIGDGGRSSSGGGLLALSAGAGRRGEAHLGVPLEPRGRGRGLRLEGAGALA